jgi:hypothetical protein
MVGNTVVTNGQDYKISLAKQRIAFFLDQEGVELESDATIEVMFLEPIDDPKAKKILFNRPFFVMLKRTDNVNPYFAAWITNTELMVGN